MSQNIKQEDLVEKKPLPSEGEDKKEGSSETEEQKKVGDENEAKGLNRDGSQKQDPLKPELEKLQTEKKTKFPKRDSIAYNIKRLQKDLEEIDKQEGKQPDPEDDEEEEDEDSKPVTLGMLKKIQAQNTLKTALQLADEIQNETERELVKFHIENTIRPSEDPKRDLETARTLVNAVKNRQILEEVARKPEAKKSAFAGGGNPEEGKVKQELTPDEIPFTKPPFNMTKEFIISKRPKA